MVRIHARLLGETSDLNAGSGGRFRSMREKSLLPIGPPAQGILYFSGAPPGFDSQTQDLVFGS